MILKELIKKGASKTFEFEGNLLQEDRIAKTVVAFSNTSGGKLIIGVNHNCEIIGVDDAEISALQEQAVSIIKDNCAPIILAEICTLNIEGKLILVIDIARGNSKPYFLKKYGKEKGTYIRKGGANRLSNINERKELERQTKHISFDEEICFDKEFKEIDIAPLQNMYKTKHLNEEKLKDLKLIKEENGKLYPTNGLLIILGKSPNCNVKCASFKEKEKSFLSMQKEYEGDVFSVLENTLHFIFKHLSIKKEKALSTKYEILESAIYEALINAFIHRNYVNDDENIKVNIYENSVKIVSPGGFLNCITANNALNGLSHSRNRVVANIFKELGLAKKRGSGLSSIIDQCKNNGLESPRIEEENGFVCIEIIWTISENNQEIFSEFSSTTRYDRLKPVTTDYDRVRPVAVDYGPLSLEEKTLLLNIFDKSKITSNDAFKLFDFEKNKIKEILDEMKERKLIVENKEHGDTFYTLS